MFRNSTQDSTDITLEEITFFNATSPNIWYFTCEILIATIAVPGNLLVITSFCRAKNLRRCSNYFVISLAIADLMIGCVSIPVCLTISVGLPKDALYGCLSSLAILRFDLCGSMLSYLLITFDRGWAIAYPYSYQRNMKSALARGLCIFSWTLAAILAFVQLAGWFSKDGWEKSKHRCFFRQVVDYYYQIFSNVVIVYFSIITMLIVHIYIFRVLKNQKKMSSSARLDENRFDRDSVSCNIFIMKFHGDALLASRLGKIVFVFMICQMPMATTLLIWTFCGPATCLTWSEWGPCCVVLIHVNAAINPFLYAFHLPDFRMAMKDTLRALNCRNQLESCSTVTVL